MSARLMVIQESKCKCQTSSANSNCHRGSGEEGETTMNLGDSKGFTDDMVNYDKWEGSKYMETRMRHSRWRAQHEQRLGGRHVLDAFGRQAWLELRLPSRV